jgi:hypothetical protein
MPRMLHNPSHNTMVQALVVRRVLDVSNWRVGAVVKLREVVTGFARIDATTEGLSNGEGPDGYDVGVPPEDR